MTDPSPPIALGANIRWSRCVESEDFFIDEDRLRLRFHFLVAGGLGLVAALAAGLAVLRRAAETPPVFVGISHGLIFSGAPESIASVRDSDFDRQLSDTVEVLFTRTEKGAPPALADFCAPELAAAVDRAYREAAAKFPAGYEQTLALAETRTIASRPGYRHVRCRGLLSSRSVAAAQTSPIYLDCVFAIGAPTPRNATGWRLLRAGAIGRDDFYRPERERAERRALELPVNSP
jgi:hypothetical protein